MITEHFSFLKGVIVKHWNLAGSREFIVNWPDDVNLFYYSTFIHCMNSKFLIG